MNTSASTIQSVLLVVKMGANYFKTQPFGDTALLNSHWFDGSPFVDDL